MIQWSLSRGVGETVNTLDITKPEAQFLIVAGVIGGSFLGYQAVTHMFAEGLTTEERKGLLSFAAITFGWWGVSKLIDLDKIWWMNLEAWPEHLAP